MSEREIKVGAVWRNVHDEMTVVQVYGRIVSTQKAPQCCWMNMEENHFRAMFAAWQKAKEAAK